MSVLFSTVSSVLYIVISVRYLFVIQPKHTMYFVYEASKGDNFILKSFLCYNLKKKR